MVGAVFIAFSAPAYAFGTPQEINVSIDPITGCVIWPTSISSLGSLSGTPYSSPSTAGTYNFDGGRTSLGSNSTYSFNVAGPCSPATTFQGMRQVNSFTNVGTYWASFDTNSGTEYYYRFTYNGSNWNALPAGDGNNTTHIVRINTPVLYATTTSPAAISFDYYQSSTSPAVATAYTMTFTNTLTYETKSVFGNLDSPYTTDGTYNESTTSPPLSDGTWKMTISLVAHFNGAPTVPYETINTAPDQWFGINFNNNVQTLTFGPATEQFASSTCAINFTGSFSFSDCMGYLFEPSAATLSAYQTLPAQFSAKFPFSYIAGIQATWNSLAASTTANSPTYAYNFHDLGIGSTTSLGNILPNETVFSASTTKQYFPAGTFNLLKGLASIAIILGLFADIFFGVKGLITT